MGERREMMAKIESVRELEAYRMAFEAAMRVYNMERKADTFCF